MKQARFVTAPLHWRTYLWMNFTRPEPPDASLLPRNKEEAAIWRQNIKKGWTQGLSQAKRIFTENLARLKSDYLGMVLYKKLLAQQLVSEPFVAKTDLGITGGGDDLTINDQVLRITALPQLEANPHKWKAVIAHDG